jgi:hypothetical protein
VCAHRFPPRHGITSCAVVRYYVAPKGPSQNGPELPCHARARRCWCWVRRMPAYSNRTVPTRYRGTSAPARVSGYPLLLLLLLPSSTKWMRLTTRWVVLRAGTRARQRTKWHGQPCKVSSGWSHSSPVSTTGTSIPQRHHSLRPSALAQTAQCARAGRRQIE